MIGIFEDKFVDYLKHNLGDPVDVKANNIVCRCPFCEMDEVKKHYHCWISLDTPLFNCFHSDCNAKGHVKKLIKKISGRNIGDRFIDPKQIDNIKLFSSKNKIENKKSIFIPPLNKESFPLKELYIKKRLKFHNVILESIDGLIFDVIKFIQDNKIELNQKHTNIIHYLQNNFVGFITEHRHDVIFRNIDPISKFKHFKLRLGKSSRFLDYYKLKGYKPDSNTIVLGEGVYDIFGEHIYDSLNIKQRTRLYAAALSTGYESLIKSLSFHEQIFNFDVHILSDRGLKVDYYRRMKKRNKHLISSMTIYYNKKGKDFNDIPAIPEKFVV